MLLLGGAHSAPVRLIGGIGPIAPDRKKEIALVSLKALVAGVLASFMTATIAGVLV